MKTGPNSVKVLGFTLLVCLAFWNFSRQDAFPRNLEDTSSPGIATGANIADSLEVDDAASHNQPEHSFGEPSAVQGQLAEIEQVSFDPVSPVSGDSLKAVVVASGGGSHGKVFSYRWKINGQVVQESQADTLSHAIKRGDFVELEVRAGGDSSSDNCVSCYMTVANAPPVMKLAGQEIGNDGKYEAQLEALDPERDLVTFNLKSGPAGMSVDAATGKISWAADSDVQGTFSVEVSAKDIQGAETIFSYQIKIRRESGGGH